MTLVNLTEENIARALMENSGLIEYVARQFNCSPKSIRNRINASPELQKVRDDARESVLDESERQLFTAMREGKAWAIRFVLANIGKSRGYGEKQEIELTSKNVNFNVDNLSLEEKLELEKLINRTIDQSGS